MTTENQKSNVMKLIGTLFSYGGKQASTGSLVCTFIVSDPYRTGNTNPDGSPEVAYETILKASMIVPQKLSESLNWEPFTTKKGKAGIAARISFYGEISLDRRDQKVSEGEFRKTVFWLNPKIAKPTVREDGSRKWADCSPDDPEAAMMVFPIVKREKAKADAPKAAAPKAKADLPGVTVAAETPAKAAVAKIKKVAKPKIVHNVDLSQIPFA
jgi:hypothetical protein